MKNQESMERMELREKLMADMREYKMVNMMENPLVRN